MTLTARPRLPIRFAVLAAVALCGIVLALSSTGTPPVGAQDGSAPAKPTGVVATATHDSVALAWDDPGDASITHYQIFRRDRDVHDTGEFVRNPGLQHRLGGDELHGCQRGAGDAATCTG